MHDLSSKPFVDLEIQSFPKPKEYAPVMDSSGRAPAAPRLRTLRMQVYALLAAALGVVGFAAPREYRAAPAERAFPRIAAPRGYAMEIGN